MFIFFPILPSGRRYKCATLEDLDLVMTEQLLDMCARVARAAERWMSRQHGRLVRAWNTLVVFARTVLDIVQFTRDGAITLEEAGSREPCKRIRRSQLLSRASAV